MARNLKNGLAKDGLPWLEQKAREAVVSGEERCMTEDDLKQVVHDAVLGNWGRRSAASKLTGEWIIYAQYKGENYYLCLGEHGGDHQKLRQQIDAVCTAEFPFLSAILDGTSGTDDLTGACADA